MSINTATIVSKNKGFNICSNMINDHHRPIQLPLYCHWIVNRCNIHQIIRVSTSTCTGQRAWRPFPVMICMQTKGAWFVVNHNIYFGSFSMYTWYHKSNRKFLLRFMFTLYLQLTEDNLSTPLLMLRTYCLSMKKPAWPDYKRVVQKTSHVGYRIK